MCLKCFVSVVVTATYQEFKWPFRHLRREEQLLRRNSQLSSLCLLFQWTFTNFERHEHLFEINLFLKCWNFKTFACKSNFNFQLLVFGIFNVILKVGFTCESIILNWKSLSSVVIPFFEVFMSYGLQKVMRCYRFQIACNQMRLEFN